MTVVRITHPERQRTARRELGRDAAKVVTAARATRASLASLTKLVSRTRREVETETDDGIATVGWIPSSERERLEDFYRALTWLQHAENEMRHLRGHLERAIERAERRIG